LHLSQGLSSGCSIPLTPQAAAANEGAFQGGQDRPLDILLLEPGHLINDLPLVWVH
jgi:hypothetical protein